MHVALPLDQNGRPGMNQGAKLGCRAAGDAARRIDGGHIMSKVSSAYSGKKLPLQTEREYAEKFSPVIEDMNLRRISKAVGRSVETVKAWRARRAFPNGASLLNAAKAFPAVRNWLLDELDGYDRCDPMGRADMPQDLTQLLSGLDRVAAMPGPEGDMARALLKAMHEPRQR